MALGKTNAHNGHLWGDGFRAMCRWSVAECLFSLWLVGTHHLLLLHQCYWQMLFSSLVPLSIIVFNFNFPALSVTCLVVSTAHILSYLPLGSNTNGLTCSVCWIATGLDRSPVVLLRTACGRVPFHWSMTDCIFNQGISWICQCKPFFGLLHLSWNKCIQEETLSVPGRSPRFAQSVSVSGSLHWFFSINFFLQATPRVQAHTTTLCSLVH